MASGSDGSHDAPLLVFHQCMDKEWLAWGRESAQEFARQGFARQEFAIRAQGRLKTTRYKTVSKKKQLQDSEEHRDKIAGDPAR